MIAQSRTPNLGFKTGYYRLPTYHLVPDMSDRAQIPIHQQNPHPLFISPEGLNFTLGSSQIP
jgi:hypothetical protein